MRPCMHAVLARFSLRLSSVITALTLTGLLASCGGNQDQIRIGAGQSNNGGSTSSIDFPIFYVKRTTPDINAAYSNHWDDVRRLRVFNTNADLYMRDRTSTNATERNITARVHPSNERWDVKDLDVAADGSKVIFAMRGPLTDSQQDNAPPTWNIWEYNLASDSLRRVMTSNADANAGQDVSPHYLPDGHIVFSSTRQIQSKEILISENKPDFEAQDENASESAFVLHVMNADGTNIQQITYNPSHDLDSTVISDGRIVFSRWDHALGRDGIHFYATNPDGTNTELLYGSVSHNTFPDRALNGATSYPTVQFTKPREMPDSRILSIIRPYNETEYGGELYLIDTQNYVENNQLTLTRSGTLGFAQKKPTLNAVRLINAPSSGGRFIAAAPLWDNTNRLLVSWSQCRLIDPSTKAFVMCNNSRLANPAYLPAPPSYGLWLLNPNNDTQQPILIPNEGEIITDVVIAQPRNTPIYRPYDLNSNLTLDTSLKTDGVGILDIRSVYDFDGITTATSNGCSISATADITNSCYTNRPARFLRIEKAVSLPASTVRKVDPDAFGVTNSMREILGYIPIEPDGSVRVKIPANVAFQIAVVDTNGRRISNFPRHNAWLSLRPGETVQCNGCHTVRTNTPTGESGFSHGRNGLFNSVYSGANSAGAFTHANHNFTASKVGETMARARAAWSCSNENCASITPSVNIAFSNVWPEGTADSKVIPTSARSGDFTLPYQDTQIPIRGLRTLAPTSTACLNVWTSLCRVTINYLDHIQTIWERGDGFEDLNHDGYVNKNDNCLVCHSPQNIDRSGIPAGHLDLRPTASTGLRVTSYQQLVVQHDGATTPPIMAGDAAHSRFFNQFSPDKPHHLIGSRLMLTPGELKLISEWIDIGAQYYNDPFKAPVKN